jgi:ParB-like chromosome segregation protein Spo0J
VKQGRVYKEYETLRGVRNGGDRKSEPNNTVLITQEQIAKELGVSVDTIQNLKRLQTLSPDLQDLISEGKITATTGYKVLAKLSQEEQEELIQSLDVAKRLTQKERSHSRRS